MAKLASSQPGQELQALALQRRALHLALPLWEKNPQSIYYGRPAALAYFLTYKYAEAFAKAELAQSCLAGCFSVLNSLHEAKLELDQPMRDLHAELKAKLK